MSASLSEALRQYAEGLAPAVRDAVRAGAARVPALAARLQAAGVDAGDCGPDDLAAVPVLTKDDVIALQAADPPFGGLLGDDAAVRRVFQSPGPLYEPQLDGPDPWRWASALRATGIGPGDLVLNCFGYHLSPAGAMFDEGALAVGARVLPGGIGNQDLQARAVAAAGVTAYTGLPSYLKAILERYAELGLAAQDWRLSKALVTAEPLPDSLRSLLQERVPTVLSSYGTAETGLIAHEVAPGSGLRIAPGILVQVCDLDTGAPLTEGEGQVVITLLRPDYPLVRFGTGDLSAWSLVDGEPRLVGVLGRVGAAVKVRGMFLHPRQAAATLAGVSGLAAWRLLVDRVDHRDELTCEIVSADGAGADLVEVVADRIRAGLRFNATVASVAAIAEGAGTIEDRRNWS